VKRSRISLYRDVDIVACRESKYCGMSGESKNCGAREIAIAR
jgi:hypothetical protein